MNYREAPRPNSPVGPGGGQEGDAEQDYRSVFNRLPSPCRPDSPVLPPIDYAADRIQNDLLDEICSDMGIKVDVQPLLRQPVCMNAVQFSSTVANFAGEGSGRFFAHVDLS